MTTAHVCGVAKIEKECFSMPWSEQAFAIELEKPESLTFVALCDGEAIGFVNANIVLDEIYINNVAVTEKFRKKGVAQALLNALEQYADGKASFITLEVRATNIPAQALYKKCGYEVVGVRKNFYEKPTEDAVLMTKNL